MLNSIEVLRNGISSDVQALNEDAFNDIFGGAMSCKKGYSEFDDGTMKCGCDYTGPMPKKEVSTTISTSTTVEMP